MKRILAVGLLIASVGAGRLLAAEQTWTGTISDSQCGVIHEGEINEHDCTLRCIQIGFEYVLVTDAKVLKISNQKFAGLSARAGQKVKVTGELKGDAIAVSKIETVSSSK